MTDYPDDHPQRGPFDLKVGYGKPPMVRRFNPFVLAEAYVVDELEGCEVLHAQRLGDIGSVVALTDDLV